MNIRTSLQIVFYIAIAGMLFSGYLSYTELFAGSGLPSCPSPGAPGTVFGYPACVYGFFMYLILVVVSSLGLRSRS